jgi:mono/diheme cytochrome c family protein
MTDKHLSVLFIVTAVLWLAGCISNVEEKTVQICIPANSCPDIPTTSVVFEGDLVRGATIFEKACASCHGLEGRGIREKDTRDLTNHGFQRTMTDRQIKMSVRLGKGKMPSFILPAQQVEDLLVFVRSLDEGAPEGSNKGGY